MFRVLFLILVVMSSVAFAQGDRRREARMISKFGLIGIEQFEALLDSFFQEELQKDRTAQGFIINYGSDRRVARNLRIVRSWISQRKIDVSRIVLVKGGFLNNEKTEIWIVPSGTDPPELLPTAVKFAEIERATNLQVKSLFEKFGKKLREERTSQGYIINYGTAKEIAKREKQIRESISLRDDDPPRITLVRGGNKEKLKSVFWIVPNGAEPPTP